MEKIATVWNESGEVSILTTKFYTIAMSDGCVVKILMTKEQAIELAKDLAELCKKL